MIKETHVVTGFLLLVSLLAVTQPVLSQQYTTTTMTTLATGSEATTVAVGTQLITTTSGQVFQVYAGPRVHIAGTHGVCGVYFVQAFNGTAGEVLTGTVSTNSPVNVYLLSAAAFKAWQHLVVAGGTCTPSSPLVIQTNVTAYTLSTTIPAGGTYDLVVNNLSASTVTAQITANLSAAAPALVIEVAYSTTTQQVVQTLMETSVQTIQTTSNGPDITLAAVVFAILIIAAGAYLAKTRRSKTAKNEHSTK